MRWAVARGESVKDRALGSHILETDRDDQFLLKWTSPGSRTTLWIDVVADAVEYSARPSSRLQRLASGIAQVS